jgi:hypothetical protein
MPLPDQAADKLGRASAAEYVIEECFKSDEDSVWVWVDNGKRAGSSLVIPCDSGNE